MTAKLLLHLCGPMDHLRLTWQAAETLLENVPFAEDPESTRYNILLAIQEMVTNILRHGYQDHQDQPVEIKLEAHPVSSLRPLLRLCGNWSRPSHLNPNL